MNNRKPVVHASVKQLGTAPSNMGHIKRTYTNGDYLLAKNQRERPDNLNPLWLCKLDKQAAFLFSR
ncbi:hypothetical protein GCM10027217_23660 [Pseudomaricurvus hydrocarbonicus]